MGPEQDDFAVPGGNLPYDFKGAPRRYQHPDHRDELRSEQGDSVDEMHKQIVEIAQDGLNKAAKPYQDKHRLHPRFLSEEEKQAALDEIRKYLF